MKPSHEQLFEEIIRRKKTKVPEGQYVSYNRQKRTKEMIEWLESNPVDNSKCEEFIRSKVIDILKKKAEMEKEREDQQQGLATVNTVKWYGPLPSLRLIHCIVDDDEIKKAFLSSFDNLTRQELDARNSVNSAKPNVWAMISSKWNDKSYKPVSTIYQDLHDDFLTSHDLSLDTEIGKMGVLGPDKAKEKFYSLKNILLIVKSNWERSGNGDGNVRRYCEDNDVEMDPQEIIMENGDDRKNFLGSHSPAVLYLWIKAEENQLLDAVGQVLKPGIGGDTSSMNESSNKKRANESDGNQEVIKVLKTATEVEADRVEIEKEKINIERERDIRGLRAEIDALEDEIEDLEEGSKLNRKKQRCALLKSELEKMVSWMQKSSIYK